MWRDWLAQVWSEHHVNHSKRQACQAKRKDQLVAVVLIHDRFTDLIARLSLHRIAFGNQTLFVFKSGKHVPAVRLCVTKINKRTGYRQHSAVERACVRISMHVVPYMA